MKRRHVHGARLIGLRAICLAQIPFRVYRRWLRITSGLGFPPKHYLTMSMINLTIRPWGAFANKEVRNTNLGNRHGIPDGFILIWHAAGFGTCGFCRCLLVGHWIPYFRGPLEPSVGRLGKTVNPLLLAKSRAGELLPVSQVWGLLGQQDARPIIPNPYNST